MLHYLFSGLMCHSLRLEQFSIVLQCVLNYIKNEENHGVSTNLQLNEKVNCFII